MKNNKTKIIIIILLCSAFVYLSSYLFPQFGLNTILGFIPTALKFKDIKWFIFLLVPYVLLVVALCAKFFYGSDYKKYALYIYFPCLVISLIAILGFRKNSFYQFHLGIGDVIFSPHECNLAISEETKNRIHCVNGYTAEKKFNISDCLTLLDSNIPQDLPEEYYYNTCIESLIDKKNDFTLCSEFKGTKNKLEKYNCLVNFAIKKRGIPPEKPTVKESPFAGYLCASQSCYSASKEIGINFLRGGTGGRIIWETIEHDLDENYNWKLIDSELEQVYNKGFEIMETIKSANQKDQQSCHSDCKLGKRCKYNPCDWNKYENFLKNTIKRYKDKIKYWQIENEPAKGNYYWGTPEEYAELLEKSYKVIKEECPDCKVLNAGMMYCNYVNEYHDYFPSIMSALRGQCDGTGCFDIFDVHIGESCTGTTKERKDFTNMHLGIDNAHNDIVKLLNENKIPQKSIWISEFGPLACKICPKIENALIKSYVVGLEQGFEKMFWRMSEPPSRVIDEDGNKTTAFYAYKTLISQIGGFTSLEKLADGQYKFLFLDKKPVYVLWRESDNVAINSEIKDTVRVIDYSGKETSMDTNEINLTENPIFVIME